MLCAGVLSTSAIGDSIWIHTSHVKHPFEHVSDWSRACWDIIDGIGPEAGVVGMTNDVKIQNKLAKILEEAFDLDEQE